jgi:hypothetical protein
MKGTLRFQWRRGGDDVPAEAEEEEAVTTAAALPWRRL